MFLGLADSPTPVSKAQLIEVWAIALGSNIVLYALVGALTSPLIYVAIRQNKSMAVPASHFPLNNSADQSPPPGIITVKLKARPFRKSQTATQEGSLSSAYGDASLLHVSPR